MTLRMSELYICSYFDGGGGAVGGVAWDGRGGWQGAGGKGRLVAGGQRQLGLGLVAVLLVVREEELWKQYPVGEIIYEGNFSVTSQCQHVMSNRAKTGHRV